MTDWWHTKQWRLIQTNLREIDMRDIRAAQVVADLQAFRANMLMINAAGIIASYPTKLPFHFQSPFLTGDSLLDIIEACHAADIRVFARTDFSKVRRPIYEDHPDWAYISPTGHIVDYNGDVHVCINGPYQQDYALRIIEELLSTHDFDGIFFNMGGYQTRDYSGNYYGICHCRHCTRLFEEMYGSSLPDKEDLNDTVFRTYTEFKQRTLRAHHEKVYRFIADRWPHICIANHTDFHHGFIRQESNTAIDRPLPHWQYNASDNTKWAVGSFPEMVSSNTTVDFIDFPYRHVAVSPDQQALRLVQSLANGGTLDYYLIGRLDNHEDRSGFAPIKDIFHYHAAHEEIYVDTHSLADVLLLKAGENINEYRGWFRVLAENHFLFDVIRLDTALDRPWDQYKAVIVPEITALSDALAAKLDRFAADGGVVIAVGQTGFRDENYNSRPAPALRCLGIEEVLRVREEM
ncbi:MAG: beta-galactosidase trimerization domain-containing protein, partial [Anaerolineae bacterium]